MDRFKFRARRLCGDLHIGYIHPNSSDEMCLTDAETLMCYLIDPKTIEQCTGLKDINGKLIYEGDFVIFPHWENPTKEVIHWHKADNGWHYGYLDCPLTRDQASMCEVVGNIHENPDLM